MAAVIFRCPVCNVEITQKRTRSGILRTDCWMAHSVELIENTLQEPPQTW